MDRANTEPYGFVIPFNGRVRRRIAGTTLPLSSRRLRRTATGAPRLHMSPGAGGGCAPPAPATTSSLSRRTFLQRALTHLTLLFPLDTARSASVSAADAPKMRSKTLSFVTDDGGVQYADEVQGTGATPQDGDLVVMHYIGYLSNGKVFDNTRSKGRKPVAFVYGKRQMLPGIEVGIRTMKAGGKRRIIVPSEMAFGKRGVCVEEQGCLIPPDETLTYDVELLRVAVSPI